MGVSNEGQRAHLQGRQQVQGVQSEQHQRLQEHHELTELPRQTKEKRGHEDGKERQPLWREDLV